MHLAQVNLALPKEPLDSELLAEFMAWLDPVNAIADESPGFVWRLQTDDGNATGVKAFGDDRLVVNMSVWESAEALRAFVYGNLSHRRVMRRRREWFHKMDLFQVLWWVPEGHIPDVGEAEEKMALLGAEGPSGEAFTFREVAEPVTCP